MVKENIILRQRQHAYILDFFLVFRNKYLWFYVVALFGSVPTLFPVSQSSWYAVFLICHLWSTFLDPGTVTLHRLMHLIPELPHEWRYYYSHAIDEEIAKEKGDWLTHLSKVIQLKVRGRAGTLEFRWSPSRNYLLTTIYSAPWY